MCGSASAPPALGILILTDSLNPHFPGPRPTLFVYDGLYAVPDGDVYLDAYLEQRVHLLHCHDHIFPFRKCDEHVLYCGCQYKQWLSSSELATTMHELGELYIVCVISLGWDSTLR